MDLFKSHDIAVDRTAANYRSDFNFGFDFRRLPNHEGAFGHNFAVDRSVYSDSPFIGNHPFKRGPLSQEGDDFAGRWRVSFFSLFVFDHGDSSKWNRIKIWPAGKLIITCSTLAKFPLIFQDPRNHNILS